MNRLSTSTSPYLLQHAHNPVNWYEWGEEALTAAKKEDKPILVSIGYSSCHWCHVMERESFEDKDIAALMNEYLICIKVDREERPDVDQLYMEAVQSMGLHGGWPLNVFLTPSQKPFFGGTYFPPQNWSQILRNVHKTFQSQRQELENTALEFARHLAAADTARFEPAPGLLKNSESMFAILQSRFDNRYGGIDKAPKFVMPSQWLWLLRLHYLTGNPEALRIVEVTLDHMARGGLYDVAGGGFARYSVDTRWFVPHFEKMLYDNAQLITLYSEAYRTTRNDEYRRVAEETIGWLAREMSGTDGGLFSALDADSEGVEGKYYVWTRQEVEAALGVDVEKFCTKLGITEAGNWEHGRNILRWVDQPAKLRSQEDATALKKLRAIRDRRVRPGLDDKILTSWNAMAISAFVEAHTSFGKHEFLDLAVRHARFITENLKEGPALYRSFKGRRSETRGFLDDYAFFIRAMTDLYQATFDDTWIDLAREGLQYTVDHFYDPADGFFYYTSSLAEPLIARKKEIFDNVIPSSNSVMARNLNTLGELFQNGEWKDMSLKMVLRMQRAMATEPTYLSNWGLAAMELSEGLTEVVFGGRARLSLRNQVLLQYHPFCISVGAPGKLPLAENRGDGEGTVYVCQNRTCQLPVPTAPEALEQIKSLRHARA